MGDWVGNYHQFEALLISIVFIMQLVFSFHSFEPLWPLFHVPGLFLVVAMGLQGFLINLWHCPRGCRCWAGFSDFRVTEWIMGLLDCRLVQQAQPDIVGPGVLPNAILVATN